MSAGPDKPFVLAVPSKGRLQDNAAQFFARAGMILTQPGGARDYRGKLPGFAGLEIAFLPVAEIVTALAEGQAHLGVAGEDLIREAVPDADARVTFLARLGFGQADVVVAVPRAWIDVRSMPDLEDVAALFHARRGRRMRVATKYVNLTRGFFAERGVGDYRIVESLGATFPRTNGIPNKSASRGNTQAMYPRRVTKERAKYSPTGPTQSAPWISSSGGCTGSGSPAYEAKASARNSATVQRTSAAISR